MILALVGMPVAFVLSLAVAIQGWRFVDSRPFGADAHLATGGALIGMGLGCIGLPLLWTGWSPLWMFFLLPFSACVGAVVRGLVVSLARPYRWPEWGLRSTRAGLGVGAVLALGTVALTLGADPLPRGDTRGYRFAFALGCLLLGLGLCHLPGAMSTVRRCTLAIHFALLAAPYFGLPLLAVIALGVWKGENPLAATRLDLAFHPLVRGCLVATIASTGVAIGAWIQRTGSRGPGLGRVARSAAGVTDTAPLPERTQRDGSDDDLNGLRQRRVVEFEGGGAGGAVAR